MKRTTVFAYIGLFILLFVMPTLASFFISAENTTVNYEKRELTAKPKLTIDEIADYPEAYEAYYNDHLPFRSALLQLDRNINFYALHQSPVDKVILGKEDWLFYYSEKNDDGITLANYYGLNEHSEEQLNDLSKNLTEIQQKLKQRNCDFILFIVPDKESLYGTEFFPNRYLSKRKASGSQQIVDYLTENTDIKIVYVKKDLAKAMKENPQYEYYYRSDSHWNALGAYTGAQELMTAMNLHLPAIDQLEITKSPAANGDLAAMMGLPNYTEGDTSYLLSGYGGGNVQTEAEDFSTVFRYHTTGMDQRKLFIVRDSFCSALAPYLSPFFNESFMIHRGYYREHPETIIQEQPNIVVYEVAERYIDELFNFTVELE